MKRILIIGATSAIAEATARRFAANGDRLHLVARDNERLQALAKDLRVLGAPEASIALFDANTPDTFPALIDDAWRQLNGIDIALIAHGTLSDQKACERDVALTLRELQTNALSAIALLTDLANRMETQRKGTLAVITSVAGDRGRQSNYIYGTAKAALNVFLQGLRNRLYPAGVHVLTIKPGFVDSPMTASFKKGALWAQPDDVAAGICKAIDQSSSSVYLPFFWRWIMLVIRLIPETVFKRLKL